MPGGDYDDVEGLRSGELPFASAVSWVLHVRRICSIPLFPHPLILSLGTEFASQIPFGGLRGALQVQRHIFISFIDLPQIYAAPHISLSIPREVVVIT